MEFIREAIEQINWEKYKRGYSNCQDLDKLAKKLRSIRDGDTSTILDADEINKLKAAANKSLSKIYSYDYGPNLDGNKLRREALEPVFAFMKQLEEMEKQNENSAK